MTTWRRKPAGAAIADMQERMAKRNAVPSSIDYRKISPGELESQMRSEGASDHLIEVELQQLRELHATITHPVKETKARMARRRTRQVEDDGLSPYVEAEIRRLAGVAANEVIEEMNNG